MGDLAGPAAGACCCGKSKAALDNSNAPTAIDSACRAATFLSDSMRRILFAEPFNLTLLSCGVFRALCGYVRAIQVPANT